jgi:hypothetical protein
MLQGLFDETQHVKSNISGRIDFLYQECLCLFRAEMEVSSVDGDGGVDGLQVLPSWICELFASKTDSEHCDTSHSSFTSAAVAHLDAAIHKLDPFHPSLAGSLDRLQTAHSVLTGRLEFFRAEYEQLWGELQRLYHKLKGELCELEENYPLIKRESELIVSRICDSREFSSSLYEISRASLKRVLHCWRRIEKDRIESVSGSILLIGRLWNLLDTQESERFALDSQDLSLANLRILSNERTRLINFQHEKFKELYDTQQKELSRLMTALKWSNAKQTALLAGCAPYTADGLQFLSVQLATLQPKLELSLQIFTTISTRHTLIDRMRQFEKSASDPARLFRSSFQLLQEEKFRKTALPSLLNLENQLRELLSEFSRKFQEDFYQESEDSPYSAVLEEEISNRFVSSGIFGFDNHHNRKDRTPRYVTDTRKGTNNSNHPPPLLPQRRKLDKSL